MSKLFLFQTYLVSLEVRKRILWVWWKYLH